MDNPQLWKDPQRLRIIGRRLLWIGLVVLIVPFLQAVNARTGGFNTWWLVAVAIGAIVVGGAAFARHQLGRSGGSDRSVSRGIPSPSESSEYERSQPSPAGQWVTDESLPPLVSEGPAATSVSSPAAPGEWAPFGSMPAPDFTPERTAPLALSREHASARTSSRDFLRPTALFLTVIVTTILTAGIVFGIVAAYQGPVRGHSPVTHPPTVTVTATPGQAGSGDGGDVWDAAAINGFVAAAGSLLAGLGGIMTAFATWSARRQTSGGKLVS